MQDRGVEVVDGEDVLNGAVAVFVGGAVDRAALDAAAREPEAEAVGVVVASVGGLHEGRAAEFA